MRRRAVSREPYVQMLHSQYSRSFQEVCWHMYHSLFNTLILVIRIPAILPKFYSIWNLTLESEHDYQVLYPGDYTYAVSDKGTGPSFANRCVHSVHNASRFVCFVGQKMCFLFELLYRPFLLLCLCIFLLSFFFFEKVAFHQIACNYCAFSAEGVQCCDDTVVRRQKSAQYSHKSF